MHDKFMEFPVHQLLLAVSNRILLLANYFGHRIVRK
jgi:hypothetical protein